VARWIGRAAICAMVLLPYLILLTEFLPEIMPESRKAQAGIAVLGSVAWVVALYVYLKTRSKVKTGPSLKDGVDEDRISLIVQKVDFPRSAGEQMRRDSGPECRLPHRSGFTRLVRRRSS